MHSRDKIEQHLITQKARAVQYRFPDDEENKISRCQYRTSDGKMCAAGCLIPDDKYTAEMEGGTVFALNRKYAGIFPDDISEGELTSWQSYHDNSRILGQMEYSYKEWIEGNEEHHPSKFKKAVVDYYLIHGDYQP